MLPKVLELFSRVEDGFVIQSVVPSPTGALTLTIGRGAEQEVFRFEAYEVPAIHQECNVVGVAK